MGVAVLSDRNLVRQSLIELMRKIGHAEVREAASCRELLAIVREREIGLVLVDLDHQRDDPRRVVRDVHEASPATSVVMMGTTLQNAALAQAADGWLETPWSDAARLQRMTRAACRHHRKRVRFPQSRRLSLEWRRWARLTSRQREVIELLSQGVDNLKIAAEIGISESAVKAHVSALLRRFGADSRSEVAVIAARAGLRGERLPADVHRPVVPSRRVLTG